MLAGFLEHQFQHMFAFQRCLLVVSDWTTYDVIYIYIYMES